MVDINLSKSVRSNLSSLQNTASLMSKTSDRLSSGNKVNSALDNPTNFFTASSLNSRAGDLNQLMDSMANGIKTIEAANNGLTSITKNLESMQSTLRQARQDKSFQTESFSAATATLAAGSKLSLSKGAVGDTAVDINLVKAAVTKVDATIAAPTGGLDLSATDPDLKALDGQTVKITSASGAERSYTFTDSATGQKAAMLSALGGGGFTVAGAAAGLTVTNTTGENFTLSASNQATATALGLGTAATSATSTNGVKAEAARNFTTDELVADVNNKLAGSVRASNDNGKLRIENLSTQKLEIVGASGGQIAGGTTAKATINGNSVRADLADQFNELRDQLDKLSDDASFNGINLLRGDNLKITFNETGSSSIEIQSKDGKSVNSANLKIETTLEAKDLDSDTGIDKFIDQVKGALNKVRSQSSAFGSNLSIVQNRQDFTKSMINTLETGAGNLTLADMNQEAANMMALQTRQSLASSTLSMANQADQNVLQLLR